MASPPPIAAISALTKDFEIHLWRLGYFLQIVTYPPRIQFGNHPSREDWLAVHSAFAFLADSES